MLRRVSERRIVDVLVSYLRKQHLVAREVPHYEKRIDVAALPFGSDEVVAIEAKTKDWLRAVSQAIVNLAAAERSYIAIHTGAVSSVSLELLEQHRIGLISVGTKWGDVKVIKSAPLSPFCNPQAVGRVRQRLTEGSK
jgi:hypothetical protein